MLVGFGVLVDLGLGELLAGLGFAGGVADEGGGVSDEEDDGVAELLEVAQLAHQDGVAEMEVGGGGVEAGFDAERDAGFEAGFKAQFQVFEGDDLGCALGEEGELFFYGGESLWAGGWAES